MNEKKTLIAIRKVLAQWNLSCAEESCLKKQLADELLLAVKNCNAPAVSESFYCHDEHERGRCDVQCSWCASKESKMKGQ